jgi:photosystem II stability/assembly factor-like uncharacterized protein
MKTSILLFTILTLSVHLQSQGWVRQNPFARLDRLNDVDFDGVHGLTVGNEGVLFTTDDGGNTWTSRKTPDADEDLKTAFIMPGTNGQTMLAGGDSLLLLSTNGGANWSINFNDIQGIYKIELLPTGEWMVLGATYGARSSDQGGFWQPFNNPALGATAGHFTSVMNGWVEAGDFNNSQVWVTTNGGFNWALRDPVKFSYITNLDMLNDTVGYLITGSQVYKTTDGGWSWESQNANPTGSITDLHVITQNEVWTSLDNGDAFYSLTAGNSWIERNPNLLNNNNPQGIYATLDGKVYMSGKYVSMLYSDDFGLTWRDQIPGTKATMFQPHFINELIGIVGGSDGTLMRTINGGTTWAVIQFPKDDHFFAVSMIDNLAMVIGSSRGRVFFSDNLGASWDTIATGLGQITDIQAFNRDIFIVTTEDGRIYRTTDQGVNWNNEYDNGGNPLFALDFITPQKGWACGYNGEIVVTTNGGTGWSVQPTPGKAKFSDITFTTEQEGWAVSSSFSDSLWYTENAGQTWQTRHLPYASYWNGVSFTNPDTGWIDGGVTGVGDVLRTNDRGLTWTKNHTSPEIFLGIYAVPGKETVWAVGFGGNIMKYSPCNTTPMIADLTGVTSPCKGDTVQYSVTPTNVDNFLWHFPPGWTVLGNSNASSVTVIAGENTGEIKVIGENVCGNITSALTAPATPVNIPEITIGETKGNVLFTNVTSLEYQWLLNGVPIPGANSPFYTALENGSYQLLVTVPGSGCSGISNALEVTIVGVVDSHQDKLFIYPVPARNLLYLSALSGKEELEGSSILLIAPDGRLVKKANLQDGKLDVSALSPGIYMLILKNQQETLVSKVLIE